MKELKEIEKSIQKNIVKKYLEDLLEQLKISNLSKKMMS